MIWICRGRNCPRTSISRRGSAEPFLFITPVHSNCRQDLLIGIQGCYGFQALNIVNDVEETERIPDGCVFGRAAILHGQLTSEVGAGNCSRMRFPLLHTLLPFRTQTEPEGTSAGRIQPASAV